VKFHDGTDFNAKAVKYNMDKYRASPCPELKVVSSVDVVDDYTVRLNLSEFQAPFISYFTLNPGEMMSPTSMETHDEAWNLSHPVGTGPFKFVSYQRNVSLKYERFDGYWQKGKPYLDAYEFIVVSDQTVAMMAFKARQGIALSTNVPSAVELQKEGKYIISSIPVWSVGLAGDSANPDSPFADIRVRRAVSYAIDNAAIAKTFGPGFLRASNQPAAPEGFAYNKAVVGYPFNPQKAKELLREAGYPNGFKTKIIYQSTHTVAAYFPAIQGYLREVGIDAELQGIQGPLFNQFTVGGWKNGLILYLIPARLGYDPTKALRDYLSSKSASYPSIIRPADYEAKLSKAIIEADFEKRKALTQEAVKMVVEDYCLANFILLDPRVHARYSSVHDLRFCEIWYHLSTPEDAWLGE
jgi:peptide/nickel transport system substrate-binding protein